MAKYVDSIEGFPNLGFPQQNYGFSNSEILTTYAIEAPHMKFISY